MSYHGVVEAFKTNIEYLKANYGAEHFTKEKSALIWEELKDFSPKQIDSVVRKIVGECEFAPKAGTFRTWASCLREKIRQHEREQERQDAQDFWATSYTPEDRKWIVRMIQQRIMGKVSDDEYEKFKNDLKRIADDSEKLNRPQPAVRPHYVSATHDALVNA